MWPCRSLTGRISKNNANSMNVNRPGQKVTESRANVTVNGAVSKTEYYLYLEESSSRLLYR